MAPANTKPRRKSEPTTQLSIVGQRELKKAQQAADDRFASPAEVSAWVKTATSAAKKCRLRRRHIYPTVEDRGALTFIGNDDDGFFIHAPIDCEVCPYAYCDERWRAIPIGRGRATFELVSAKTAYRLGPDGEEYTNTGHGRITTNALRTEVATANMSTMTLKQIEKQMEANAAALAESRKAAATKRAAEAAQFRSAG